jgi:outer membrane protein TolC
VGVRSSFPLGDPSYFSRKSKAKAAVQAAQSQKEGTEESVRLEVMEAINQYEGAKESLPLIQQAVEQAAKSLELFRPLYREGRQSILDVLRAEDALSKAQTALFLNLYQLHSSYARLLLSTGKLETASIKEIQENLETAP